MDDQQPPGLVSNHPILLKTGLQDLCHNILYKKTGLFFQGGCNMKINYIQNPCSSKEEDPLHWPGFDEGMGI